MRGLATPPSGLAALLRFQLRAGARAAVREVAPGAALLLAGLTFFGPDLVRSLGGALFPPDPGPGFGSVAVALVLCALARTLWPRAGAVPSFFRSLPLATRTTPLAGVCALAAAQLPAVAALAMLLALGGGLLPRGADQELAELARIETAAPQDSAAGTGQSTADAPQTTADDPASRSMPATWVGLLLLPIGTALTAAAMGDANPRALLGLAPGLVGSSLLVCGSWLTLGAGVGLLAIASAPAMSGPRRARGAAPRDRPERVPLPLLVAWRSIGARPILESWSWPLLGLGAAALFVANNELPAAFAAAARRLGVAAGLALQLAGLARAVQLHRPPWAWSRSLPWSAARRVGFDLAELGLLLLPPLAVAAAFMPMATLQTLPVVPYLALRAAAVARAREERFAGGQSMTLAVEGALLAGVSALRPWLAVVALLAAPLAWRTLLIAERRQRPTVWQELVASDPLEGET